MFSRGKEKHQWHVIGSDISKIFLRIPFEARDFGVGAQKNIIVIFEE